MSQLLSISSGAALFAAFVFGGMMFFAMVMAPLIFTKLAKAEAGAFIRQVFPVYYLVMMSASAGAAALAYASHPREALAMVLVTGGFAIARQVLMPQINAAREQRDGGEVAGDKRFKLLHRLSFYLNTAQLGAVAWVLLSLFAGGSA